MLSTFSLFLFHVILKAYTYRYLVLMTNNKKNKILSLNSKFKVTRFGFEKLAAYEYVKEKNIHLKE